MVYKYAGERLQTRVQSQMTGSKCYMGTTKTKPADAGADAQADEIQDASKIAKMM